MLAIATTLAAARRRVRALAVLLAFTSVAAATLACVADAAMVVVAAAAVCSGVTFALDALDDTHVDEATYWTALLAYTRTPASVGAYARHLVGRSPPTTTIAVAVERYNRALTPT